VTSALRNARVIVAGAGVFGSAIAVALARAGARVVLADPAACGDNASGIAAGMLAPAFEAVLDPPMARRFELLREARDLWPGFAAGLGDADIGLRRTGAIWLDDAAASLDALEERLEAVGARPLRMSAEAVRRRLPGVAAKGGVYTGEDWRLSPGAVLKALQNAARQAGVELADTAVTGFDGEVCALGDRGAIGADRLVVATGAAMPGLAPELALLQPIKGQILSYPAVGDPDAPSVRCPGGYVAQGPDGVQVGATMEAGRNDREVDPAATARLRAVGEGLFPRLAGRTPIARAAVRAATPDGLPLVGPSSRPGVWLAVGARRNGWLLAPLVARMAVAHLGDGDPDPHPLLFAPRRYSPG